MSYKVKKWKQITAKIMSLKSWCFNRQSTQVWCFILHVSRLQVHNNLRLILRRVRVNIICLFQLLLYAQSRWTKLWSSNNFHCQYIRLDIWIGHNFLYWAFNRFHCKYISFIGNLLFPVALGQKGLLKGWFTRSFEDSRMFQGRVIRLSGVILYVWACIH